MSAASQSASEPLATPTPDREAARRGRAIALMILGVGLFSIMDALVKWLGESYPTVQLVFFRSLFAFIPLGFLMFRDGVSQALRMNDRQGHLLRAVVGVLALWAFFYAFAHMPLADVIAITFAAPVFVTALSVPLLGERVGLRRWSAVLVGFLGVLIMIQPGAGVFQTVALVPLGGVVFYALAMVFVRKLSRTETSASIVFYFTLACTLVSGAALPFSWVTPEPWDWALLVALGLIGGMAQITFTRAVSLADVSVIMPFEYTAMLWAVVLGFFIWGEVPGNNIWIGVAIVMASGLYILYREASLGLVRGRARKLHARR
ncbi:MAG: DMT family transporter [Kiloniellales bacterium]|nr:DMT family transporter [Kiloniellales bacterium]